MNVAGFASEDDRRRFYGDDDLPPPSEEIELGRDWRARADPAAVYTLRWVKDSRQIYITRRLLPPMNQRYDEADEFDGDEFQEARAAPSAPELETPPASLPVTTMDFGIELLGWADDLGSLQNALEGWEVMMRDDDGLQWVRQRLVAAAEETDRQRGSRPRGWWPGLRRTR